MQSWVFYIMHIILKSFYQNLCFPCKNINFSWKSGSNFFFLKQQEFKILFEFVKMIYIYFFGLHLLQIYLWTSELLSWVT